MFVHYLKIAVRNIRKYALQNIVSCIGLAAGLVCLSFSALWIHFEESFDSFHKDADRIYTLSVTSQYSAEPYMAYLNPESLEPLLVRNYGILFLISSALGFIVGYPVIKVWQQQFQQQATISWWIYAVIFTAMSLVICMTVGHRVLKTARENPADVIKSE